MLKQIGDATETETGVVRGGPAPKLEVTTFEIDGDALHAGDASTLVVRIANHGSGTAYRVVATTRSSIDALHGQHLSFGSIKPGADKVRKLKVSVPATETARDTMLVLALSEGNGAAPANVSRRLPIAPSSAAPVLAVHCTIGGRDVARPDLDAGQRLTLRCIVNNTGDADAKAVELEVSVASRAPARSPPQAIAASGHLGFDVPIIVPRELPIDAPVEIAITVRDRQSSRTARTTVVGVVRKPKLCVPGQLTRAQYQAKVAELRAAVTAKYLTQDELDRYDAELVTCLK
jgi:cyclophilin family peptidyl-prolyl cis-trans isomerase